VIIRIATVPAVLGLLAKIAISLKTPESARHWAAAVRNRKLGSRSISDLP
jgi:hypothetical protein